MSEWTSSRAKYLYAVRDERILNRDQPPLLSVSQYHGVVPRSEVTDKLARAENLSNYKVCYPGEIVINRMSAYQGALGIARQEGLVSPEYIVLRPLRDVEPRFLTYLFKSTWFIGEMAARVRGIGSVEQGSVRTPRINPDDLGDIEVLVPDSAEQRVIADYLDAETARIDALIDKKQRMVDVLTEHHLALRAEAVTTGLKVGAATTTTGNPFAPVVPDGWDVRRLKTLVTSITDTAHATAPGSPDGSFLVVRTANVKNGELVLDDAVFTDETTWREWTQRRVPQPGDVLFTREAPAGEACLVPEHPPLCLGQRMVLLTVDESVTSGQWLVHSIYAGPASQFIAVLSRSTTVAHLNMSEIGNIPVVVPPLHVQEQTLRLLHERLRPVSETTERLMRQLLLLREHRSALITAAVTGELAVPGVAA